MLRVLAVMLSLWLAIATPPGFASQSNLWAPTTGTLSGLTLVNNYNAAIDAVNTKNSGSSAPANQLSGVPSLGNEWCNLSSTPYPCAVHDGAGTWLTTLWIDPTNHIPILPIGGGVATVASAGTTDLCGVPQNYLTISGTTSITSFGSICPQGTVKFITFSGSLTLTYNATSLIIPGAANIPTSAADQATLVALGSGNWQVANYTPVSGTALINPAIDVGAVEWTFSPNIPSSKYLWAQGQAVNRATYPVLMTALTITQSVTRTNGSPTLTGFSDTTQIPTGAAIEGSGIPANTTILSCASTSCTMSANASSSGTGNVALFPNGDGDGSTTFNLPDCRGVALVGRDNMGGTARGALTSTYAGGNPDALGAYLGHQNQTLAQSALPNTTLSIPSGQGSHTHTPGTGTSFIVGGAGGSLIGNLGGGNTASATSAATLPAMVTASINGGVTQTAVPTVQPIVTANCMIRVLARLETAPGDLPRTVAVNDNARFSLIERRFAA